MSAPQKRRLRKNDFGVGREIIIVVLNHIWFTYISFFLMLQNWNIFQNYPHFCKRKPFHNNCRYFTNFILHVETKFK